MAVRQ